MKKNPIIVALDFDNLESAKQCVHTLDTVIDIYKVGLELFLNTKGEILDFLKEKGKEIFLDLKFHDIPNTTNQAAKFALNQDVFMFNVHASGGEAMMSLVAKSVEESEQKVHAIAVTVLTSLSDLDAAELFLTEKPVADIALNLATQAKNSGLSGVVCSPFEAHMIKKRLGNDFITVCPGIRPAGSNVNDQKRIATPQWAMENGVDFMVIGRPITQASNPKVAALNILKSIGR